MVNLAESVRRRFDVFGRLQDVEYAITLYKIIVDATVSNHPRRATRLSGLSKMLYSTYRRALKPEDLEDSIKFGKEALSVSSPRQPHWAELCHALGHFLRVRFENTGSKKDIEDVFDNVREAVETTPRQHVERDSLVASLGAIVIIVLLFERLKICVIFM